MNDEKDLRLERLALLIGTMLGQVNELLNQISKGNIQIDHVYRDLLDINNLTSLHLHEIYYKGNTNGKKV